MAIVHKAKPLGGVSLNYEVVGGTTAPTTFRKENTIWVNTGVEITGHAFEYNAPNYLTTSDIWIQTDIDRAPVGFNAIKKNELMVYPYLLKRWNGNKFITLGGALYQNGIAIQNYKALSPDPALILNLSDQVTSVTGGWNIGGIDGHAYEQAYNSYQEAWVMSYDGHSWAGAGWMQTVNKIKISGYSKLRLTGSCHRGYGDADKGDGYVYIALVTQPSGSGANATGYCGGDPSHILPTISSYATQTAVKVTQGYYSNNDIVLDLDVSDIDGEYYIQIGRYNQSGYDTFTSFFKWVEFFE